ncbi:GFA family protein [Pseudenhygromyxa sp. WMMC2535]|uniref:GFA family protein n=1 Tax=Pseudenhygromyxa sp. WMMC2535 TaxID=2712867 RepID=UPI001556C8E1|nr:GFA family protein [Pseudenhygromyxa sp. WMMC2535]NVB38621.1 GFA family protein [Pseudenhygromyxa sp. WMMC2535]
MTNTTEPRDPITGSCACGGIRYRIDGALKNARSCHCSRCRKTFSGQASAYAEVDPEATFTWTQGEALLTRFETMPEFGLAFCSRCGSTLCGTHRGRVHGVTLGCVDGDPGVVIEMHIFVDSKAPWEVMPEGVVSYPEGPPSRVHASRAPT